MLIQKLRGQGAALPTRPPLRAIALAWLGGTLAIATVALASSAMNRSRACNPPAYPHWCRRVQPFKRNEENPTRNCRLGVNQLVGRCRRHYKGLGECTVGGFFEGRAGAGCVAVRSRCQHSCCCDCLDSFFHADPLIIWIGDGERQHPSSPDRPRAARKFQVPVPEPMSRYRTLLRRNRTT